MNNNQIPAGTDLNTIPSIGTYVCKNKEPIVQDLGNVSWYIWHNCKYEKPISSKIVIVSGFTEDVGGELHAYSTVGYYVESDDTWYSSEKEHLGEELKGVRMWTDLPKPHKGE